MMVSDPLPSQVRAASEELTRELQGAGIDAARHGASTRTGFAIARAAEDE